MLPCKTTSLPLGSRYRQSWHSGSINGHGSHLIGIVQPESCRTSTEDSTSTGRLILRTVYAAIRIKLCHCHLRGMAKIMNEQEDVGMMAVSDCRESGNHVPLPRIVLPHSQCILELTW